MVKFSKRGGSGGNKQESFNFLGFTFCLGFSAKGIVSPKLKREGKRFRAKLQRIKAWFRDIRNKEVTL